MRGKKDEEKLLNPMFPRLHVSDTEKGGPRAPPRNKMALYERLSILPQKFSSGSASTTPPPSSCSAPSTSSSQMAGRGRSIFSSFSELSTQSHPVEKLHSHSSRGTMLKNMTGNYEQKLVKTNLESGTLSSSPQSNSFGKSKFSNLENVGEKLDVSVSAPDQGISEQPKNDVHYHEKERMSSSVSSSVQFRIACEPQTNITVMDLESRKFEGTNSEGKLKLREAIQDPAERPTFTPSARDEATVEANTSPSTKFKDSEKANWSSNRLFDPNVRTIQACLANIEALKNKVGCIQVPGVENSSTVIRESCSASSPRNGARNFDDSDICSRPNEHKKCATVDLKDVDRQENNSDASTVDPVSAPNISPNVVVRVIGEKQFWEARKAIVHQQRLFAVQVFELHRLIKVQRLIAESPHVLLDDFDKSPSAISAFKNKPTEYGQLPPLCATPKDRFQHLKFNSECAAKNPLGKLTFNKGNGEVLVTQKTSYELPLKNATAAKSEPWCLNPIPGNQWLVPVMSPSEGLVYKPYTGPFPPNAGYMAPMYGNCGSMSLNTGSADFFTTSFHQGFRYYPGIPLNQPYFPPYSLPVAVANQSVSGSATDETSLFAGVKSNKLSTGDVDYLTHEQNLCNISRETNRVTPFHARKFHGSKGIELQGSTDSIHCERGNGEALPLFPTEPMVEESNPNAESSELKSRAIKVVPHNPRSATESAARIFQLIQEERKQQ